MEPSKPVQFSEFLKAAIKPLEDLLKKKRQSQEPRENVEDLRLIIARAQRVKTFMNSNFWQSDLSVYLQKEESKSISDSWRPGEPFKAEDIAAAVAFESGRRGAIKRLVEQLRIWVEDGEDAQVRIDLMEKRNKTMEAQNR